jgi:hypothetical protein
VTATAVRAQIISFLTGIDGLTTLYRDAPYELTGDNWQNNSLPGTPAFLHINSSDESRITVPAVTGWKHVEYDVSLVALYQYWIQDGTGPKDAWITGQDALLDAIVAKIRTDPAFGSTAGSPIFEAGNQDSGIRVTRDIPHWDQGGGKVMAWFRVDFKVTELVQA